LCAWLGPKMGCFAQALEPACRDRQLAAPSDEIQEDVLRAAYH
jgi:hypothetical protein